MKIETKFNQGDWVWILEGDKVREEKVNAIKIQTGCWGGLYISYQFHPYSFKFGSIWKDESEVFGTKEELLKSL